MPSVTGDLLVDLAADGTFSTDLTASTGIYTSGFWKIEQGFSLRGRGRKAELDAAGMCSAVCRLDNSDGRFSPLNGSSPYQSGGVNRFRPYIGAHVKLTFNGVTYDQIKGVITDIKIGPEAGDQLCEITIRDYMFILSRTEIRRPIMLNQYTGVITHRLLDDVEGAEGREACTNPAFAKDLTGWTAIGAAVPTRITADDKVLEGPGSCRVVNTANNDGMRFTMTGRNGMKYKLSAYVLPEDDSQIGLTARIDMRDNVGFIAAGTTGTLERDHPTRLEVTGTYNGGSTSQYLEVVNATGNADFRIGAAHAVPFVNAFERDIDDGQSRLETYTYHRGPALSAIQEVRENELGGLFYFTGNGTARFEERHYRFGLSGSSAGFNERGVIDFQEVADDRIKEVIFDYPHYVDGTPGTVVWESDRIISLPIGFQWRVEADYQGGLVRDSITPVANTDYFINSSGDGTGTDMTGSVTFTFDDFGGGSVGYFTNNATKVVYLRSYRVRGTPVRLAQDKSPARYTATGGPVLAATLSHDFDLNAAEPHIQAWAEYVGLRYSTQRARIGHRIEAPFPEAAVATTDMTRILSQQISQREVLTNNNLPFASFVNDYFYVDAIDLRITGESIVSDRRLSPVDDDYWILGTDELETPANSRLAA